MPGTWWSRSRERQGWYLGKEHGIQNSLDGPLYQSTLLSLRVIPTRAGQTLHNRIIIKTGWYGWYHTTYTTLLYVTEDCKKERCHQAAFPFILFFQPFLEVCNIQFTGSDLCEFLLRLVAPLLKGVFAHNSLFHTGVVRFVCSIVYL